MSRSPPVLLPGVLAAVAAGGVVGALARYALGEALPTPPRGFPWTTLAVNGSGCLLIGVLMTLLAEGTMPEHRLTRPFLGSGVLGGYTTFSTYAVETERLLNAGEVGTAVAYLAGTVVVALAAVRVGSAATRAATRLRRRRG